MKLNSLLALPGLFMVMVLNGCASGGPKAFYDPYEGMQTNKWPEIDIVFIDTTIFKTTRVLYPRVQKTKREFFVLCLYGDVKEKTAYLIDWEHSLILTVGTSETEVDNRADDELTKYEIYYATAQKCPMFRFFESNNPKAPELLPFIGTAHPHPSGSCQPSVRNQFGPGVLTDEDYFDRDLRMGLVMVIVCGPEKFGVVVRGKSFQATIIDNSK